MMYAVIMAGGRGTRLWPQSRENTPKQLWKILGGESLLQATVKRVEPLVAMEQVYILTVESLAGQIAEQLPQLPDKNIIIEPVGRSTAPCAGLAALYIADPDACMVVLPADHVIRDNAGFLKTLQTAVEVAQEGEKLVTFGIKPSGPETGFGYIQKAQALREHVYAVRQFTEKPDIETATHFIESGEYYWNSGMFVWKVSTLMTMIERYLPDLHQGLMTIQAVIGSADEQRVIADVFQGLESVSIDYGIMEKAESTYVVSSDFGWSDVGSWAALPEVWDADQDGNVVKGRSVAYESRDNIVYSDSGLTALIGVENLIVVNVGDTVLVCEKDRAQDVKKIVELLEQQDMREFL
ncbi:mannose-1-phosphate guanylyltransferase [candidate division KSB3 bacterium]|uniref:mannose-1-phosphate guanylyltransferase n=1 Tax=candidate division KSB3 bacterium TaxID=2044937 RepID=A0A2G6E588_9BACT|nr:MAG: mannose-1-phosphate guanylyltransferase [candidate division KSB3 bacterium]PIE29738.1 MAG: mannose-1-phosphate guanylyltransferase [candidate division KSB3 bacterium]